MASGNITIDEAADAARGIEAVAATCERREIEVREPPWRKRSGSNDPTASRSLGGREE